MSTSPDADRYAHVTLNLSCPKCGSEGLIPLNQLHRMLFCHGCRSRFGLERRGLVELPEDRIQVQVRTHSSDWEGHEAIVESRSTMLRNGLLDWARDFLTHGWGRWALAAGLTLLVGVGIALGGRAAAVKPPLEIPDTLDGRVKLFSQALARRDMGLLIRLTDPSQHRALRIWLAHGTGIPEPVADEKTDLNVTMVSPAPSASGDRIDVRAELSTGAGKKIVLDQQWARHNAVWYFQPVRLRSPSVVKGPVKPYSKRTVR